MTASPDVKHELKYKGYMKAHGGWVTSLAIGEEVRDGNKVEFLLSGSRDKTLIKWDLDDKTNDDEDREWGTPRKMFTGKLTRPNSCRPLSLHQRSLPDQRLQICVLRFLGRLRASLER